MYNDPTEYSETPFMESTQGAYGNPYAHIPPHYNNPYESGNPYGDRVPSLPPPPPPKQNHRGLILAVMSFLCLVAILVSVFSVMIYYQNRKPATVSVPTIPPTLIPTAPPTPTPLPTAPPTSTGHNPVITGGEAPYPASQITASFYKAGLAPQAMNIDTSWSCCEYYPEGGAAYWADLQTGITMDLATFASIDEAQIDGKNLTDKGFNAYVENYCLLSYGGSPSDLQSYLNIMSQVCFYK